MGGEKVDSWFSVFLRMPSKLHPVVVVAIILWVLVCVLPKIHYAGCVVKPCSFRWRKSTAFALDEPVVVFELQSEISQFMQRVQKPLRTLVVGSVSIRLVVFVYHADPMHSIQDNDVVELIVDREPDV